MVPYYWLREGRTSAFIGIYYTALSGLLDLDFEGGVALIIGSALIFIGALFFGRRISFSQITQRDKRTVRIKRPSRRTFIWIVVVFVSGAGVFYFLFGFSMYNVPIWLKWIPIIFLAGLCLYAVFVLISGRAKRIEEITEIKPPTDSEDSIDG